MRLIAADARAAQATGDYAELAVCTVVYHCLQCGPIMRELLPDGNRITYHRTPLQQWCIDNNQDEDTRQ